MDIGSETLRSRRCGGQLLANENHCWRSPGISCGCVGAGPGALLWSLREALVHSLKHHARSGQVSGGCETFAMDPRAPTRRSRGWAVGAVAVAAAVLALDSPDPTPSYISVSGQRNANIRSAPAKQVLLLAVNLRTLEATDQSSSCRLPRQHFRELLPVFTQRSTSFRRARVGSGLPPASAGMAARSGAARLASRVWGDACLGRGAPSRARPLRALGRRRGFAELPRPPDPGALGLEDCHHRTQLHPRCDFAPGTFPHGSRDDFRPTL